MSFAATTAEKISRLPSFDPSLYLTRIVVPSGSHAGEFRRVAAKLFPWCGEIARQRLAAKRRLELLGLLLQRPARLHHFGCHLSRVGPDPGGRQIPQPLLCAGDVHERDLVVALGD